MVSILKPPAGFALLTGSSPRWAPSRSGSGVAEDLARSGLRPASQTAHGLLTEREQDVVAPVARGLTNREVAAELYISTKAVEYHLGKVFGKLGISSRRELPNRPAD